MYKSREYSKKLLDMVDEGMLDRDMVICAMINYMSEYDVKDMMERNQFLETEEEEEF